MTRHFLTWEFVRFCLNGMLGYIVYLNSTAALILLLNASYVLAVSIGFLLQFSVSLWLHSAKTFIGLVVLTPRQKLFYLMWFVSAYLIELLFIAIMVELLLWSEMFSILLATLVVVVPSYLITKFIFGEVKKK